MVSDTKGNNCMVPFLGGGEIGFPKKRNIQGSPKVGLSRRECVREFQRMVEALERTGEEASIVGGDKGNRE